MTEEKINYKKALEKVLKALQIIGEGYTGSVTINLSHGGVSTVRREETLR